MKKIFFIIIIITSYNISAQIGINYTPLTNENSSLIIKKNNSLPEMRINTEQALIKPNQVLSSDDFGNVLWTDLKLDNVNAITGSYGNLTFIPPNNDRTSQAINSGAYITLPPGKWAVNFNFKIEIKQRKRVDINSPYVESNLDKSHFMWVRIILSDNTITQNYLTTATPDRLIPSLYLASGNLKGPASNNLIKGEIYINNTGTTPKNYYLKLSVQKSDNFIVNDLNDYIVKDFAKGPSYESNGIDRLFALPIKN